MSCPLGVPLGVVYRDGWEGRTLATDAGPAVFALTCVFVAATALMDSRRRAGSARLE